VGLPAELLNHSSCGRTQHAGVKHDFPLLFVHFTVYFLVPEVLDVVGFVDAHQSVSLGY